MYVQVQVAGFDFSVFLVLEELETTAGGPDSTLLFNQYESKGNELSGNSNSAH